jgi:hypothetical protein
LNSGEGDLPCVDSDAACFQPRIVDVRWLDYQESHIIESQASWAIELPTSGVLHVTDPHDEIEPQLSVNIVHLKMLKFSIMKPVRKCGSSLFESHVRRSTVSASVQRVG